MNAPRRALHLLLLALVLAGSAAAANPDDAPSVAANSAASPATTPAANPAAPETVAGRDWLVVACVSAVNGRGLDGSAREMIRQIEKAGSSGRVSLLVRHALLEKDAQGAPRFPRAATTLRFDGGRSAEIRVEGSPGMASDVLLATFLTKALRTHPAKRTALLFFGAGDGFRDFGRDDLAHASLGVDGLMRAVEKATRTEGRKLDLLVVDAAGMQSLEAVHEWKDLASFVVGSQARASRPGFLYDLALGDLIADPSMDAGKFANAITCYGESPATSALRTAGMPALLDRLDEFAEVAAKDPAARKALRTAFGQALRFGIKEACDLGDLLARFRALMPADGTPAAAAGKALDALAIGRGLVHATHAALTDPATGERVAPEGAERASGISVSLPEAAYDSAARERLTLATRAKWTALLLALAEKSPAK